MASGDVIHAPARSGAPLPHAAALTSSGRISEARADGIEFAGPPFEDDEMIALDDTLISAIRATGVRFNVYIADASDPAAATDTMFPATPEAENSVLIAVYPNQKAVEIRSGRDAGQVTDRIAQLGVTAAVGPFGQGQLIDGIISAVRVIANAIIAP